MTTTSQILLDDGTSYYFGKYPDGDFCAYLREKKGIRIFLSLVEEFEVHELGDYVNPAEFPDCTFLHFPIVEKGIPSEDAPIEDLLKYIRRRIGPDSLYIHCRHGRGRTGLILALILIHNHQISFDEALLRIYRAHRDGHGSNPAWKGRILPPHKNQRIYVKNFLLASPGSAVPIFSPNFSLPQKNVSSMEDLSDSVDSNPS